MPEIRQIIDSHTYWQTLAGIWVPVTPSTPLPVVSETSLDNGVATGGTIGTLIDTTRGWQVDIWEDAIVEIVDISTGISYTREIDGNTADTLNFATNPLPAAVVAGDTYSIRRMVNPLSPLDKVVIHNTAYTTPDDFFVAAIAPTNTPCLFRCAGAFSVAGVLDVTITRGGNTQTMHLNHGVVLTANCLFEFDVLVKAGDTINYQYGINCNILTFRVLEIPSAM